MWDFRIYVDGGCKSNPGNLAVAAVVCSPEGEILAEQACFVGSGTNNVAEYRALKHGIQLANLAGARRPAFFCDSALVAQQINGFWAMRGNDELQRAHSGCAVMLMDFDRWLVKYIPRAQNKRADWLVSSLLEHKRTLKRPPAIHVVEETGEGKPGWTEMGFTRSSASKDKEGQI